MIYGFKDDSHFPPLPVWVPKFLLASSFWPQRSGSRGKQEGRTGHRATLAMNILVLQWAVPPQWQLQSLRAVPGLGSSASFLIRQSQFLGYFSKEIYILFFLSFLFFISAHYPDLSFNIVIDYGWDYLENSTPVYLILDVCHLLTVSRSVFLPSVTPGLSDLVRHFSLLQGHVKHLGETGALLIA